MAVAPKCCVVKSVPLTPTPLYKNETGQTQIVRSLRLPHQSPSGIAQQTAGAATLKDFRPGLYLSGGVYGNAITTARLTATKAVIVYRPIPEFDIAVGILALQVVSYDAATGQWFSGPCSFVIDPVIPNTFYPGAVSTATQSAGQIAMSCGGKIWTFVIVDYAIKQIGVVATMMSGGSIAPAGAAKVLFAYRTASSVYVQAYSTPAAGNPTPAGGLSVISSALGQASSVAVQLVQSVASGAGYSVFALNNVGATTPAIFVAHFSWADDKNTAALQSSGTVAPTGTAINATAPFGGFVATSFSTGADFNATLLAYTTSSSDTVGSIDAWTFSAASPFQPVSAAIAPSMVVPAAGGVPQFVQCGATRGLLLIAGDGAKANAFVVTKNGAQAPSMSAWVPPAAPYGDGTAVSLVGVDAAIGLIGAMPAQNAADRYSATWTGNALGAGVPSAIPVGMPNGKLCCWNQPLNCWHIAVGKKIHHYSSAGAQIGYETVPVIAGSYIVAIDVSPSGYLLVAANVDNSQRVGGWSYPQAYALKPNPAAQGATASLTSTFAVMPQGGIQNPNSLNYSDPNRSGVVDIVAFSDVAWGVLGQGQYLTAGSPYWGIFAVTCSAAGLLCAGWGGGNQVGGVYGGYHLVGAARGNSDPTSTAAMIGIAMFRDSANVYLVYVVVGASNINQSNPLGLSAGSNVTFSNSNILSNKYWLSATLTETCGPYQALWSFMGLAIYDGSGKGLINAAIPSGLANALKLSPAGGAIVSCDALATAFVYDLTQSVSAANFGAQIASISIASSFVAPSNVFQASLPSWSEGIYHLVANAGAVNYWLDCPISQTTTVTVTMSLPNGGSTKLAPSLAIPAGAIAEDLSPIFVPAGQTVSVSAWPHGTIDAIANVLETI